MLVTVPSGFELRQYNPEECTLKHCVSTPALAGPLTTSWSVTFMSLELSLLVSLTWNGFSFPHPSRSNPTHRAQPRSWLFSEAFATAYRDPIFHSPPSPSAPHTRTVTGHLIFSCFVLMSLLFYNASILALQNHKLNGQFLHIAGLLLISLNK